MNKYENIVNELIRHNAEEEWFEFKTNRIDAYVIGEYISALSNAAAMKGKEHAYLVWGVHDESHEIIGTLFDHHQSIKNEPLEHYLARQITPDLSFTFHEITMRDKRVVLLEIPCAVKVPTTFDGKRYIRLGSSKVNLARYPERESKLFSVLRKEESTVQSLESEYQDLTFEKLFTYYAGRGITLNPKTYKKNLRLLTNDGKYNLLAQLLSDNSHIPVRVSIFTGTTKATPLYSVREFGNTCMLLSLEKILEYVDVINIVQADEEDRMMSRNDVPLFNMKALSEAIINAFVHNKWVDGNAPMITVYSDRIEILSRGTLAPNQTMEGFYLGESIPVNQLLSDIFLQLHISERSGRGVPTIIDVYGKDVFEFRENSIVVSIPFTRINTYTHHRIGTEAESQTPLNETRIKIMEEMRNNPNITQIQLAQIIGISRTAIQNNISYLKENGYIERIGSPQTGYWQVN